MREEELKTFLKDLQLAIKETSYSLEKEAKRVVVILKEKCIQHVEKASLPCTSVAQRDLAFLKLSPLWTIRTRVFREVVSSHVSNLMSVVEDIEYWGSVLKKM